LVGNGNLLVVIIGRWLVACRLLAAAAGLLLLVNAVASIGHCLVCCFCCLRFVGFAVVCRCSGCLLSFRSLVAASLFAGWVCLLVAGCWFAGCSLPFACLFAVASLACFAWLLLLLFVASLLLCFGFRFVAGVLLLLLLLVAVAGCCCCWLLLAVVVAVLLLLRHCCLLLLVVASLVACSWLGCCSHIAGYGWLVVVCCFCLSLLLLFVGLGLLVVVARHSVAGCHGLLLCCCHWSFLVTAGRSLASVVGWLLFRLSLVCHWFCFVWLVVIVVGLFTGLPSVCWLAVSCRCCHCHCYRLLVAGYYCRLLPLLFVVAARLPLYCCSFAVVVGWLLLGCLRCCLSLRLPVRHCFRLLVSLPVASLFGCCCWLVACCEISWLLHCCFIAVCCLLSLLLVNIVVSVCFVVVVILVVAGLSVVASLSVVVACLLLVVSLRPGCRRFRYWLLARSLLLLVVAVASAVKFIARLLVVVVIAVVCCCWLLSVGCCLLSAVVWLLLHVAVAVVVAVVAVAAVAVRCCCCCCWVVAVAVVSG
jgi:hypothetical protein